MSPEGLSVLTLQTAPLADDASAVAEFSRLAAEALAPAPRDAFLRALRREIEITREI